MSYLFGEIVQPSSRAFWIDEDADDSETQGLEHLISFDWIEPLNQQQIKKLVIVDGEIAEFVKDAICSKAKVVCNIKRPTCKKYSDIYKVNDELFVCVINVKLDLPEANVLVEKLHDVVLKSDGVVGITCNFASQFKSVESPEAPFVRSLRTKNAKSLMNFKAPHLTDPNFITGVTAGIVSICEVMGIPAVLYSIYTDHFLYDSKSIEPIFGILSELTNAPIDQFKNVHERFVNKGNLYM